MTRDLYRVFARIGVGRTEEGDEHLIEHGAVTRYEMAENGGARLALGERGSTDGAEVLTGDADCLGAADADDADGSTLSGGNGADGIVGMHGLLLSLMKHKDRNFLVNNKKLSVIAAAKAMKVG